MVSMEHICSGLIIWLPFILLSISLVYRHDDVDDDDDVVDKG